MLFRSLLSHALIRCTLAFESESDVSLPMSANVLRVLDADGVPVRDLPARSGVSKEAITAALGFLERHGQVELRPLARGKAAALTAKGERSRDAYHRFGWPFDTQALRTALESIPADALWAAWTPRDPAAWRANLRRPTVLPHQPMVLHRGGYPDGS